VGALYALLVEAEQIYQAAPSFPLQAVEEKGVRWARHSVAVVVVVAVVDVVAVVAVVVAVVAVVAGVAVVDVVAVVAVVVAVVAVVAGVAVVAVVAVWVGWKFPDGFWSEARKKLSRKPKSAANSIVLMAGENRHA